MLRSVNVNASPAALLIDEIRKNLIKKDCIDCKAWNVLDQQERTSDAGGLTIMTEDHCGDDELFVKSWDNTVTYYRTDAPTDRKQYGPFQAVLSNGLRMPMLGLGTSHSGGYSHSAVVYALKHCGYRLIDTAKRYGCEELLQQAIKDSGIPSDEIFVTTKLWPTDYGYESAKVAFQGSLKRLGTDYIDLFMMHWPECPSSCENPQQTLEETWRALEVLYDADLCHSIGVSNYETHHLEKLMENCSVVPHVNQIEFHPYQNPRELRYFCDQHRIQFQGYCPLGKGKILNNAPVVEIAEKHGKTPAQVLIRWSIQNGVVTIPKSTKPHRVKENSEVFDFRLSSKDMATLDALHDGRRYVDAKNIREKIDSNLPDGYKLRLSMDDKTTYRIHS